MFIASPASPRSAIDRCIPPLLSSMKNSRLSTDTAPTLANVSGLITEESVLTDPLLPQVENSESGHEANVGIDGLEESETDPPPLLEGELTRNAYSLIYTTEANLPTFIVSCLFAGIEIMLVSLALYDLINGKNVGNPFNLLPSVSVSVRIVGILCLILMLPFFKHLLDAI